MKALIFVCAPAVALGLLAAVGSTLPAPHHQPRPAAAQPAPELSVERAEFYRRAYACETTPMAQQTPQQLRDCARLPHR